MGLIKAAVEAINSTLADQWEDYISCDSMDDNTLVVKKTTKSKQISNKSRIQVSPGQVAVIFDSGKILDATAEEGIYTFDESSSPSLFAGQFGPVFKEAWQRFTYNGQPAKEQAVYYINVKEIFGNRFGSSSPIPYDDPMYHDIRIKYHGSYTFKISNPLVFFNNVVGNVTDVYTKGTLMEQANAEFLTCIAGAIGRCAADGIKYSYLTNEQERIASYMNDALDEKWKELRGMEVVSVALDTPVPDDKSNERIEKFADSRFYSNQDMAAGRMVDATANALEGAATNANGAATGVMGLGMMNMTANNFNGGQSPVAYTNGANQFQTQNFQAQNFQAQQFQPQQFQGGMMGAVPVQNEEVSTPVQNEAVSEVKNDKVCTNCGTALTGKFCSNCGTPAPTDEPKNCPKCGAKPLDGAKFCVECGSPLN